MISKAVSLRDLLPAPVVDRRLAYEDRKSQHRLAIIRNTQGLDAHTVSLELAAYDRAERQRAVEGERIKHQLRAGNTEDRRQVRARISQGLALLQPHLIDA